MGPSLGANKSFTNPSDSKMYQAYSDCKGRGASGSRGGHGGGKVTGYRCFEDAADAPDGICGRLDTITLVDAGGTETTVRRGSKVTGPGLYAVAAVLEAHRDDSHRRGVRAHDTSSQILEAQRGIVSGLAALSNEVSQSHRDTRERAERDSTGFALSSRITGHLLYLARM